MFFAFFAYNTAVLRREPEVFFLRCAAAADTGFKFQRVSCNMHNFELEFYYGKQKFHFVFGRRNCIKRFVQKVVYFLAVRVIFYAETVYYFRAVNRKEK